MAKYYILLFFLSNSQNFITYSRRVWHPCHTHYICLAIMAEWIWQGCHILLHLVYKDVAVPICKIVYILVAVISFLSLLYFRYSEYSLCLHL